MAAIEGEGGGGAVHLSFEWGWYIPWESIKKTQEDSVSFFFYFSHNHEMSQKGP